MDPLGDTWNLSEKLENHFSPKCVRYRHINEIGNEIVPTIVTSEPLSHTLVTSMLLGQFYVTLSSVPELAITAGTVRWQTDDLSSIFELGVT